MGTEARRQGVTAEDLQVVRLLAIMCCRHGSLSQADPLVTA